MCRYIVYNYFYSQTIQGHMLEVYTVVSEIYNNVDLVLDIKNFVQVEVEISMRQLKFKFFSTDQSLYFLYIKIMKSKEMKYLKVEASFLDVISRLGITKLLGFNNYDILTTKVNFKRKNVF